MAFYDVDGGWQANDSNWGSQAGATLAFGPMRDALPKWITEPNTLFGKKKRGGGGPSAADTLAAMTREQWQNWVHTFQPIENTLIDYASDETLAGKSAQKAITGVQDAFAGGNAASDRRLRGMGIQLDTDEQHAVDRERNLSQSLAEVGAANAARDLTVERQRGVIGAPANLQDTRGGR